MLYILFLKINRIRKDPRHKLRHMLLKLKIVKLDHLRAPVIQEVLYYDIQLRIIKYIEEFLAHLS